MSKQSELGKKGEELACKYLREKGITILRQNYIFDHSEIDIITRTGELIVFVEVKTRVSSYLSDPSLLVPVKKQKQIIKAADRFIKDFFPDHESRFDIMLVITNNEYTSIEVIEDAFYPMV